MGVAMTWVYQQISVLQDAARSHAAGVNNYDALRHVKDRLASGIEA